MANRVLGIEIGENLTRVVEIDYKAKNQIGRASCRERV